MRAHHPHESVEGSSRRCIAVDCSPRGNGTQPLRVGVCEAWLCEHMHFDVRGRERRTDGELNRPQLRQHGRQVDEAMRGHVT